MKKIFVVLLSLFIVTFYVYAEEINKKTVKIQTLKNNPSIAAAKLALDNAKQEYNSSLGSFLPEIIGNFQCNDDYPYTLEIAIPLFERFEKYSDLKAKASEFKSAQASYARIVSNELYKADAAYINLICLYEKIELLKNAKEKRIENKNMIEFKYNSGEVNIASLRKVEADFAIVEYDLKVMQRYIETASAQLLKAIGRNDYTTILETNERLAISEKLPQKPDYDSLITVIPEFIIAQNKLESCKIQTLKAKSQWLPSLTGNIQLKSRSLRSLLFSQWLPSLKISYTIFNGGKRYAYMQTASNNLKIASEELKNIANNLKAEAIEHYNNLTNAYELVALKTQYLSVTKLLSEISAKEYVNGIVNYEKWYSIEKDYFSSQIELLEAKKEAVLKRAEWNTFTGKSLKGK
ncbi:TolC family protein [Candidatus Endomicrobiellum trichonymphae]|uniref:TolC family protein n=1 Tax=Endomicrobium trichonymphae TaxID=1408204 RepID=UPI0008652080|nr:TolC family protein [Candidatus Endomicrobium trichonymphae]BAV58619.1 outer membrane efflux protein TolC [Candidatus Endomicrobium trichonymphae]